MANKKKKSIRESILDGTYSSSVADQIINGTYEPVEIPIATPKTKTEEKKKDTWLQSGAFGDDKGNILTDTVSTILGTAGDIGLGAVKGVASIGEGIGDLITYGVAGVADAIGKDEYAEQVRRNTQENLVDKYSKGASDYLDRYSVIGNKGDQISQGLGYVAGIIATGGLGKLAGLGTLGTTALTSGVIGSSAMGGGMSEAYQGGATDEEALKYGVIKGVTEAGTELIFGGLGKAVNAVGLSKGVLNLDDALAKKISSKLSSQLSKNIAEYTVKAGAEGAEEVIAGILGGIGKKMTYMSEEDLGKIIEDEKLLDQFIVGAVTSGIAQAPGLVQTTKAGRDYITNRTQSEQQVIDNEVEKRVTEQQKSGRVLSNQEITKIMEQVETDVEKGYISTEDIENVLVGKDTAEIKALQERLAQETDPKARADLSTLINLNELNKQTNLENALKDNQLLMESYNEKARTKQRFTYNSSEVKGEFAQKVYESASEVLDNTNRSHEIVDIMAKTAEDRQANYKLTNNAKLRKQLKDEIKDSGVNIDKMGINGLVSKNGELLVNVDSKNALNFILGHETTHLLEGTTEYDDLREIARTYAYTKGEYTTRLKKAMSLYENVKGVNIENEITSDIVGDYLFTDQQFINHLSTEKPTVFKKIYDYVKHLFKMATAGSKEARQLEQLKYKFEQAYKQNASNTNKNVDNAKSDTKYSLSDTNAKFSEERLNRIIDESVNEYVNNYARNYVVKMSPQQFIDLTITPQVMDYLQDEVSELNTEQLAKESQNIYLSVDMETGEVTGHEGRHRMLALKNAGVKEVDVVIYPNKGTYDMNNAQDYASFVLKGQNYGDNWGVGKDTTVSNLTAVTKNNVAKIRNEYLNNQGKSDIRYSLTDNQGRTLTEEQQEYFKDSKVRDEDGNLLTVYHGTPYGGFNVFDIQKRGSATDLLSNGDYGKGFYFTDDKKYAKYFERSNAVKSPKAKTYEVYLNLKNPLRLDVISNINKDMIVLTQKYGALNIPDTEIDKIYKKYNITEKQYEEMSTFYDSLGDNWQDIDLSQYGYDGVISEDRSEFVAFNPNQIKNVDNTKPTNNPDIRYSLTDNKGRTLTEEQIEKFKDSKVRDENGNLLTAYHGTEANVGIPKEYWFTTFDIDKSGRNGNMLGEGFYFTTSEEHAKQYAHTKGNVYEVYLDIKNPLELDYLNGGDLAYNIRKINPLIEADIYKRDGQIDGYKVRRYLLENGYDGIHVGDTWVAFNSNQIKNVDNTNPTKNDDIRYSLSENNDGFYSQLENVIASKMQNSADANSVLNLIKNNGVKQDELNWTGIEDYLKEKGTAKVTKQEILDYIKANQLEIETVEKGDNKLKEITEPIEEDIAEKQSEIKELLDKYHIPYELETGVDMLEGAGTYGDFMVDSLEKLVDFSNFEKDGDGTYLSTYTDGTTKFNYGFTEEQFKDDMRYLEALYDELNEARMNLSIATDEYGDDANEIGIPKYKRYITHLGNGENYRELLYRLPNEVVESKNIDGYGSPHWDESNILAHTRLQDYKDTEGNKVLFIEEIQSDIHQKGRRKGYVTEADYQKRFDLYNEIDNLRNDKNKLIQKKLSIESEINKKWHDLYRQEEARYEKLYDDYVDEIVKGDSSAYDELRRYYNNATELKNVGLKYDNIGENSKNFSKEQIQKYISLLSKYNEISRKRTMSQDSYYGVLTNDITKELGDNVEYQKLIKQIQDIEEQMQTKTDERNAIPHDGAPAELPFKKNWHEFVLRKVINEAVKNNYDKVAWTTGAQQNERYDLSNFISELEYKYYPKNDTYDIIAYGNDDVAKVKEWAIKENELEELVGKEISSKIVNRAKNKAKDGEPITGALRGLDLEIGGDGMKGFYDKIIPEYLSKYLKKWNSKLETVRIGNSNQQGFTITPEMRNAIETQGQPLYSLSRQDEDIAPIGSYNVYGKDVKYQVEEAIAPLQVTVEQLTQKVETLQDRLTTPVKANELPELEEQYSNSPIDETNIAPVQEATPPIYENQSTNVKSLFETRDYADVGDRKVNAYQYDNPEVKPYFQEEAQNMLYDLKNSVKGERGYNDELHYNSNGESGFYGTTRETTEDIAELLDGVDGKFKYTYAEIEKGLNAIINDEGAENNAVSKRIEMYLDKRLINGYTTIDGMEVPANQEYIAMRQTKELAESIPINMSAEPPKVNASKTRRTSNGQMQFEAIRPRPTKKANDHGYKPVRIKTDEEVQQVEHEKIARALVEESKTPADKNNRKMAIMLANIADKGLVFENVALKNKNRDLNGKWDYTLTSESRGQHIIGNGHSVYNPRTKQVVKVSESLNSIREEVANTKQTEQFYDYLYHYHNIDRMSLVDKAKSKIRDLELEMIEASRTLNEQEFNERKKEITEEIATLNEVKNKPVFGDTVTADISREIVKEYEKKYPYFKDFAKKVYDYNVAERQLLVDGGVISQETAELWNEMYPHYVPIKRADKNGNAINVPLDTGRTGVNAPIKRAKGGNSDIEPLFNTMAERTLQTQRAIAKNSFGVELMNTLGTKIESNKTNIDEVIDSVDAQEELLQEGKNGRKPTFTVFENGEKVTFEITKDMYDALKPLSDSSFMSKTIKPLNIASSIHRGLLTQYNPIFMLTNAIKDAQDVLINSQHPAKTYAKLFEAYHQLRNKGYWYQEYIANGGEQNSYFDSQDINFNTERKGIAKVLDTFPLKTISDLNNFIEMTPRLAEYIASREAGRSIETSMLDSARVTTNFKAGGDLTKWANRNGATFLNASIQGAMQQVRNFREAQANGLKGWANLAVKFAIASLPALLLNGLLWDDDEEYEELSDYVKQNYYIIGKKEDGTFIRIPKGRTVAVIQEALNQMGNLVTGNDEADLSTFLELVVTNLAPNNPLESNILSPIVQVAKNKTWYGEDLVPTRLQDLPEAEQYDESTDSFSKWLGEQINVSPMKINYLLDQYSGGLGDVLLPMGTPEAETDSDGLAGDLIAPLKSKFTTNSTTNNQNISDFYDMSEKLTKEAKKSYATDENILQNKYFNSVKAEMNELYKEKRELQNSDLPNSEKYNKVLEIQEQINKLATNALNSYKNSTITENYSNTGGKEYYKDKDGEWKSIKEKEANALNELNMTATDKANYFTAKNKISAIDDTYESDERKTFVIETIKDSNLNDEQMAYLYDKYYASTKKLDVVLKAGIGMEAYLDLEVQNFTSDKDGDGETINGSKKVKIFNYINSSNMGFEQKVILAKMYYPSYDEYNYEIIDYLNNRDDIDYEEMETILKTLGFKVDENGNIDW